MIKNICGVLIVLSCLSVMIIFSLDWSDFEQRSYIYYASLLSLLCAIPIILKTKVNITGFRKRIVSVLLIMVATNGVFIVNESLNVQKLTLPNILMGVFVFSLVDWRYNHWGNVSKLLKIKK